MIVQLQKLKKLKSQNRRVCGAVFRPSKSSGFILLEVIVSLIILSLAIGTLMRSFTVSLKTIRKTEIVTIGSLLAEELMEDYEIIPPKTGETNDTFETKGRKYAKYHYTTHLKEEEVDYDGFKLEGDIINNLEPLYYIIVEVYYDDSTYGDTLAAHIETYLLGSERFSFASKKENALF